jgi:hypothetical protein
MEANHSKRSQVDLGLIESTVHQGKTIVSLDDSAMVRWATRAIEQGQTMTLYLKPNVFEAIRRWYWTPERARIVGLRPVSAELAARVKTDFGIDVDGYANTLKCPRCGHGYGTYEFIQQGIEEHGKDLVRATFSLKQAAILQINPVQDTICQNCRLHILFDDAGSHTDYHYEYRCNLNNAYACCRASVLALAPILASTERV